MNEVLYGVKPTTTKYGDMQFRYLAITLLKGFEMKRHFHHRAVGTRWALSTSFHQYHTKESGNRYVQAIYN